MVSQGEALDAACEGVDQRQAWREVGEALAYGRGLHKADRAFSQWVKEQGFEDILARTRTDAIWMAQFWSEITSDLDVTHPNAVRASHRESQADLPPAPELTLTAPSKLTASIEQVAPQAKTINKLTFYPRDGFFNMTKAAQCFGKDMQSFIRMDDTNEYISALKSNSVSGTEYVETKRGNGGGTWAHPKLAIFFARWLDVRFAVWCDAMIEEPLKLTRPVLDRSTCLLKTEHTYT